MQLSLTQTFGAAWRSNIPDPTKPNVTKGFEFEAVYKLFPNNEDSRAELKRIQEERGTQGFLDHVMVSCRLVRPSEGYELVDQNGATLTTEDWVKQHLIVQQDALLAFWDVVNKNVEEKNARKSRSR